MNTLLNILDILNRVNIWSAAFRILLAAIIGGCIGIDRGRHGRAAGARTHILVCLGATITTLLGFYTADCLGFANDPLRMGAQVVSGIGFLGVGTIMIRNQSQVKGLTTAAGLWATACIGLSVGAGFYFVALLSFLTVMLTFTVLSRVERRLGVRDMGAYYIELTDMGRMKEFYQSISQEICEIEIIPAKSGLPQHVGMEVLLEDPRRSRELMAEFRKNDYIAVAIPYHP